MTITDFIAILSLIISTTIAGWTIRKDINDRGRFKLKLMYASSIDGLGNIEDNVLCLFMTNIGTKDIVIRMIAGEQYKTFINIENIILYKLYKAYCTLFKKNKGNEFFIKSPLTHKRVKEGNEESQEIKDLKTLKNLKYLYVIDSKGNKYYVSDSEILAAEESYLNYLKKKPKS